MSEFEQKFEQENKELVEEALGWWQTFPEDDRNKVRTKLEKRDHVWLPFLCSMYLGKISPIKATAHLPE